MTTDHSTVSQRGFGVRGRFRTAEEPYPRILLYCHDSWGLGHLRRTLALASALTEAFPTASALVVTGSPCATHFTLPERVDLVKLPAVTKGDDGTYMPRSLGGSLASLIHLRRSILLQSFSAFDPHLLIVDHQVLGLHGEAFAMLTEAKSRGVRTLLGLRDIIDSPEVVAKSFSGADVRWALAEGYDRICVYGDARVFDPRREYPQPPELAARAELVGYVARSASAPLRRPLPSLWPQVLVTMGGGEDGGERLGIFLEAVRRFRPRWRSLVIAGPLIPAAQLRELKLCARLDRTVEIEGFHGDLPALLRGSSAVVSMAGYNTCAEILASGRPAVLLPRTFPRREQQIRAERLAALGLAASLVEPTPESLFEAIEAALASPWTSRGATPALRPDLGGPERVCAIAAELLGMPLPIRASNAPTRLAS